MKIVLHPHPALRYPCVPLKTIDQRVHDYARQMFQLMYEAKGLGLAANQVALPYQLIVINLSADPEQKDREEVYVNPVVVDRGGSAMEDEEGCLSFPGLFQKVRRPKTVKVRAYNLKGDSIEISGSDMASRVLQHEIDHLHGVLFIDKMGPIGKLSSRARLKELERDYKRLQERGDIPSDEEITRQLKELERQA
jgi:peptide deformylase